MNVIQKKLGASLPWFIWGIAVAFYFFQFVARVSIGVMTKPLLHDLSATSIGIGIIGASFYYAYVPMQIFVGMFVDHFSIKKLLLFALVLSFIGCIIFSSSHHVTSAALSRFILGFSGAFSFVIAAKLASNWFSAEKFGFLVCTTQAIGMFGAVGGLIPILFLVTHLHWRLTMICVAVIFILLFILSGVFVKDCPEQHLGDTINQEKPKFLDSIFFVIKNTDNWLNAFYLGFLYAPMAVFGELWGASFFKEAYHVLPATAATLTSMLFIGYGIGAPLLGWMSDKLNDRLTLMLWSAIISLILFCFLIFSPFTSPEFLGFCSLFFGIINGGSSLSYPLAADLNPKKYSGTIIAFTSMMALLIGMILQPIIGIFLDYAQNKGAFSYRLSMSVLIVCILIAIIIVLWLKRKPTHKTISK